MTVRRGRCNNIGLCENATRQRVIEVPEGEPFVCPKCEADLVPVEAGKVQRSAVTVALPAVAISLAAIGVAYGVWDLYGRSSAPPAAQTVAPAQPRTEAATAAAPAVPAPEAAPAPGSASVAPLPAAGPAPTPPPTASATSPVAATPAQSAGPVQATPPASVAAAPAHPPSAPPAAPAQLATAVQAPAAPAASAPPAGPTPAVPAATPDVAPASPMPTPAAADAASGNADAAQRVQAFLGSATRVPITFNFRSSVVALTGHGERELERLVSYLKQHHATGDRLYLAGFTDNQGDPASNEAVSQKRVAAVAAALTEAGITPAHVASFGSAMPVADNGTQAGRDRNRRVEVYLAP